MGSEQRTDVLIVGAGPAGLTLAIDLARRGVSFRLIDAREGPFPGSRGKGIQPRTQELFEDLGLIDQVMAVGGPYPTQRIHDDAGTYREVQELSVAEPTEAEPYRSVLLAPQFRVEDMMRARLRELRAAPEYGRELLSFQHDESGLIARIGGPLGVESVTCRYLVGGDGGRSTVRRLLGIEFPGKTLTMRALVADVVLDGLARDAWHRFNEGDLTRQIAFCPLPHTDLFQLQAPIPDDEDLDVDLAGLQSFIGSRIPGGRVVLRRVTWASAYSMHARLAERYRVGSVFLMGDAAHVHPPTGGQGLNTSVQDAYNLGWKLGAVLAGTSDALLDTYEEERRPTAADMLGLTTGLLEQAKQGDMRRGRDVHQLDIGYSWSTLSIQGPDGSGVLQAGDRTPDIVLRDAAGDPVRLFELMRGPHWTMLTRVEVSWGLPRSMRDLRVVRIGPDAPFRDPQGRLTRTHGLGTGEVVLIRPDGYVAMISALRDGQVPAYLEKFRAADRSGSTANVRPPH